MATKTTKDAKPATKVAKTAKTQDASAVKAPSAFAKAMKPSAELAAVIGDKPVPRTEVVKQLWVYIKANNLQDAANKRNINSDARLAKVFGKPQVTMFEMAKLIGPHLS